MAEEVAEGACFAAALEWTNVRQTNPHGAIIDEGQHFTRPATLQGLVRLQRRFEDDLQQIKCNGLQLNPEAVNVEAVKRAVLAQGFTCTTVSGGFDAERLAEHVTRTGNYLIALTGFNDGHAISVRCPPIQERDRRLTIFDPNGGEFRWPETTPHTFSRH